MRHFRAVLYVCLLCLTTPVWALTQAQLAPLAGDDFDAKLTLIDQIGSDGDPAAKVLLQALSDKTVSATASGQLVRLVGEAYVDAATGAPVAVSADSLQDVVVNNRMQRHLDSALAGLSLFDPNPKLRLAAAVQLTERSDATLLPTLKKRWRTKPTPRSKRR
jgi:hypothetical protein